jgi:hypothetical protein
MKASIASLTLLAPLLAHALNSVWVTGVMDITDSETWSDEHATRSKNFDTLWVGHPLPASTTFAWTEGMGGEVRIELTCTATALGPAGGDVQVDCVANLFEGASESSGDLDGSARGSATVPAGGSRDISIGVNNTDEGGDWAAIRLKISNARATA